ncbi:hypothetical protein OHS33_31250 [Streptomyces sp. NBC_00536]|nr:hypothetical protein [Streptomyces sp. NBC_00536]WUC82438.1 hypothetical protein OHS33_31250 [Streptomyces sp. NBC_00536]
MDPTEHGRAGEVKGASMNEEIEQLADEDLPELALMIDIPSRD